MRTLMPFRTRNMPTRNVGTQFAPTDFGGLQREMNRMFDDFWRGFDFPTISNRNDVMTMPATGPALDVSEHGNEFRVQAELPGMTKDDVEVTFDDGVLMLRGEKTSEYKDEDEKDHTYYVRERAYGSFQRSLPFGKGVDEGNIKASFDNGVLTVTLPKKQEEHTKHKKIDIAA